MTTLGHTMKDISRVASDIRIDGAGHEGVLERLERLRGRVGSGLGLEALEIDAMELFLDQLGGS